MTILATGHSDASDPQFDFALARYNSDGSLDLGFGVGGKVLTDIGGNGRFDQASFIAMDANGAIVVAGQSLASGSLDFVVARYTANGSPDESFGSGGKVLTDFSSSGSHDSAGDFAFDRSGKIVVAGYSDAGSGLDFAVARYDVNGSLDATFGGGGKVLTDFSGSGSIDLAGPIVIQGNGRIVVAGLSNAGGSTDFALARYKP